MEARDMKIDNAMVGQVAAVVAAAAQQELVVQEEMVRVEWAEMPQAVAEEVGGREAAETAEVELTL